MTQQLTAKQIKQAWEKDPKWLAHWAGDVLREFGYSSITDAYVKEELENLYAGGQPKGGPAVFLKGWIDEGVD